jgi:hypothetical protein
MKKLWPFAVVALWALGSASAWGTNQIVVESRSVAPGETGIEIGVYVENDIDLNGIVIPLEIREVTTAGAFPTNTLTLTSVNRLATYLTGFVTNATYPVPDNTNPSWCGGGGFQTPGALDFVSPEGFLYSAISTFDPCLPVGDDGAPPGGTPSLIIAFDVTNVDGLFEIDSSCVTPANHLLFVDCVTSNGVLPNFTPGLITVGNPQFPPVVDDIPGQTIDEGDTFATIALDDYVSDVDNVPADMTWTAAGQSELDVSIGTDRVATITIPHPNWNGSETITFTATDPSLQSDADDATFTVNPVNDPPILNTIGTRSVLAGLHLAFSFSGSDIDNSALTLTVEDEPPAASHTWDGAGSGTFNWTTECADEGSHVVTFILSDGSLSDTEAVTINVVPNPDYLNVSPDSVGFEYEFEGVPPSPVNVAISDPGCGQLSWDAVSSETWLLIDPSSGTTPSTIELSIDTTGLTIGDYTASVTVTPSAGGDAKEILVTLSVVGYLCACPYHGDPNRDSIPDVLDVWDAINVIFRDDRSYGFVTCPWAIHDVNCDCVLDVLDVTVLIDHVFRNVTEPYCSEEGPCGAPTDPQPYPCYVEEEVSWVSD